MRCSTVQTPIENTPQRPRNRNFRPSSLLLMPLFQRNMIQINTDFANRNNQSHVANKLAGKIIKTYHLAEMNIVQCYGLFGNQDIG